MVTFKSEYQGKRIGRRSVRMKTVKGVSEWIDDEEGSTRLYSVEGYDEDFPSVTTVLQVMDKPWLAPWKTNLMMDKFKSEFIDRYNRMVGLGVSPWPSNLGRAGTLALPWLESMIEKAKARPDEVRDAAAEFGTLAHASIELLCRFNHRTEDPAMQRVLEAFEEWRDSSGLTIELSEVMVWHPDEYYAGGIDAIARTEDGELVVIDFKTGGLYDEAAYQLSAYAVALEELTGEPVKHAWVVRIPRDEPAAGKPAFQAKQLDDIEGAYATFYWALQLWKYTKSLQKVRPWPSRWRTPKPLEEDSSIKTSATETNSPIRVEVASTNSPTDGKKGSE